MAGNPLVDVFRIKDLRQRLIFTFAVLIVFRIGATIPIPGINVNALQLYYLTAQRYARVRKTAQIVKHLAGALVFHHLHAQFGICGMHRDIYGRNSHFYEPVHFSFLHIGKSHVVAVEKAHS